METPDPIRLRAHAGVALTAAVVAAVLLPFAVFLAGPSGAFLFFNTERVLPEKAIAVHGIFEWSACCAAMVTGMVSLIHFNATRANGATCIIGPIFVFAGLLDGIHSLVSLSILDFPATPDVLIPATWTASRWYVAIALATSPLLALGSRSPGRAMRLQWLFNAGLGAAALAAVSLIRQLPELPPEIFPHHLVHRPNDAAGLVLFALAGVFTLPRFYQRYPSILSQSLVLGLVPQMTTQAFMAFGSVELYDAAFFWAHALKLVSYSLPLVGLGLDYVYAQAAEQKALQAAERTRTALVEQLKELGHQHAKRHDAEEALLRQIARTRLHTRIAVAANEATSLPEALEGLIREICTYTGWLGGHVFLAEPSSPAKLVPSGCFYSDTFESLEALRNATENCSVATGEGAAGQALATGKPAWLPIEQAASGRSVAARALGIRSIFASPVKVGAPVVGVLEFFSMFEAPPSAELLETMTHVGVQFGRVFERVKVQTSRSSEGAAFAARA